MRLRLLHVYGAKSSKLFTEQRKKYYQSTSPIFFTNQIAFSTKVKTSDIEMHIGANAKQIISKTDPNLPIKERIEARVKERNEWSTYQKPSVISILKLLTSFIPKYLSSDTLPSQSKLDEVFPIHSLDYSLIRKPKNESKIQVTWIGHASLLIQMGGWNILTDPVFSNRCSAVQWAGPKRYRPPACTLKQMRDEDVIIDAVLISHNHYDHLDYYSISELADYGTSNSEVPKVQFVVPLGIRSWFESYFPQSKGRIQEIDWHESCTLIQEQYMYSGTTHKQDIEITGLPMQHWSSRKGFDRDATLWCGFSITTKTSNNPKAAEQKFLFTGDTGYFDYLSTIGSLYGPFDLAAIPIGAYEPRDFMKPQHLNPEDAVKMMIDVKAKKAVPIHWGTFQLTFEPFLEPRERLEKEVERRGIEKDAFKPWLIGETFIS